MRKYFGVNCFIKLSIFITGARHDFLHAVHRKDIKDKRIAVTFREISKDIYAGDSESKTLVSLANSFQGAMCF